VVDRMTRGVISQLTRWRVEMMIVLVLFIILGLVHMMIQLRPIRHTWLV